MALSLQILIVRRFLSAFLHLVVCIGEVDQQFGMIDPLYRSFEGFFQLLRVNTELNLKCKAELFAILDNANRVPARPTSARLLTETVEDSAYEYSRVAAHTARQVPVRCRARSSRRNERKGFQVYE